MTFQTGYDKITETAHQMKVYPNPAAETLYIQGLELTEVQVFNAFGQMVKTFKNTNEINVCDWAKGMYVLRITTTDGKVFERKVTIK